MDTCPSPGHVHDENDSELERECIFQKMENVSREIVVDKKCEAENTTVNQCLFCLNLEKADNTRSSLNSTWFKMLMRYLEIKETSTLDENSDNVRDGEVFICEKCVSLGKEIWKWYEHFETIRLCLDRGIRSLLDILKEKTCPQDISSLPMEHLAFRNLTIKKCLSKIGSSPKVLLEANITSHHSHTCDRKAADGDNYDISSLKGDIDPSVSCKYCPQKFKDQHDLRGHVILQHPFQFHSKDLPPGLTLEQRERDKAIQTALWRHRRHPKNLELEKGIDCLTCSRHITYVCNFRKHFLQWHFNEVVDLLQTTIPSRVPPKTITEDIQSYPVIKQELPLKVPLPQEEQSRDLMKQGTKANSCKFSCDLCPKTFRTQKALHSHQKTSNGKPKRCHLNSCSICGKHFTSRVTCWRHWKSHNPQEGRNAPVRKAKCTYCEKRLRDTYDQRNHEVCIHPFQVFAQKLPPSTTEAKLKLGIAVALKKIQDIKKQGVVKCGRCKKQFKKTYSLRTHILRKHFDLVLKVINDDMMEDNKFSKTILWRHQKMKKSAVHNSTACSYCGKLYKDMGSKRNHEIISHTFPYFANMLPPQTTERKLKEAITITKAKHLDHEKNKNWKRKGVIGCVTCERKFQLAYSLRMHILFKHFDQVVEVLRDKKEFFGKEEETFTDSEEVMPVAVKQEAAEIFTTEIDLSFEDETIISHYKEDPEGDCQGIILNSFSLAANDKIYDTSELDAQEGEDVILGC